MAKQENKPIRAGIALYQAAMANPTDYLGFLRLVHLRKMAAENDSFIKSLNAIWEPIKKTNRLMAKSSPPIRGLIEKVITEFNIQLSLIKADITSQNKSKKAEFDNLIEAVKKATIKADDEWSKLFDCPRPKTSEDWQRLAVRAGISADFALKGQWTPDDVLPIIEGYLQRLKDQQPKLNIEQVKTRSRSKLKEAPKRSWNLAELDKAIQEYKRDHAAEIQKILSVLESSKSTAVEKTAMRKYAQSLFGRNVLMRKFGVRGGKLVAQTTTHKSLSALLGLKSKANTISRDVIREDILKSNKMVLRSAFDEPADENAADGEIIASETEKTLSIIRKYADSNKKDAKEAAKSLYKKYTRSEMSDEQVRETIKLLDKKKY
ncbi:MAG: hypothetical protein A2Y12_17135 [Planctomycetes bacterium GWF2_42_9]|nr:MAG: hypothetical protein A2Y12_17135 [Planctomycetes bacterium GWF2_42_9]